MFSDAIWGNVTAHINTGEPRDIQRVKQFLASPDIHVAYLLGDGHELIDYCLSLPNIELIVVRKFNPFNYPNAHITDIDGQLHQLKSPQDVYNNFSSAGHSKYKGNKKVRWIWGYNEPVHQRGNPAKDLYQLNNWLAQLVELFCSNGYGIAIGGYAVAKTNSLPVKDLDAWKSILDAHAKWRDLSHFDIHEYEFAFLPINYLKNVDVGFPFSLLDKRLINAQNWSDIPYTGAAINNNWKLGNFAVIFDYNDNVLGHEPVIWGRGEWSFDTMTENWWWNNAIGNNPPLEQTWREMFGIVAKGVHTLKPYYAYLHSPYSRQEWSANRNNAIAAWGLDKHNAFIIKQAEWFKANSGKNCLYNVHFAWSTNPDWRTEDISHPDYLPYIQWMQTKQHTITPKGAPMTTPTPVPNPTPVIETIPARIRATTANLRIRSNHSTSATILGILPMTFVDVKLSKQIWSQDGYAWKYIEYGTITGYVAEQYIEVQAITPIPDIVLTDVEKHLIAAYREHDYASLIALLNTPQIVILTEDESALLEAYDERDIRRLLTFVLAVTP